MPKLPPSPTLLWWAGYGGQANVKWMSKTKTQKCDGLTVKTGIPVQGTKPNDQRDLSAESLHWTAFGFPAESFLPLRKQLSAGNPLSENGPRKKPRPLIGIFHGIILALNHLDLICHLDFDICHSNPDIKTAAAEPLIPDHIRKRWL